MKESVKSILEMQWLPAITSVGSLGVVLISLLLYLHGDLQKMNKDTCNRLDNNCNRLDRNLEAQSARSDKLYEMFIQLLKERK